MTKDATAPLEDPLLATRGIAHGFGRRGSPAPPGTRFPEQVHGVAVWRVEADGFGASDAPEADAVVSAASEAAVGVVTADCVPILAASEDGRVVAAIHAGWRGLAAGVVEAGLAALAGAASGTPLVAAIGPAARGCCYEVDEPVRRALAARYPGLIDEWFRPGRPGHGQLDLSGLATAVVALFGVENTRIGVAQRRCTICDSAAFESFRRDGDAAGRLRHFIIGSATIPRPA